MGVFLSVSPKLGQGFVVWQRDRPLVANGRHILECDRYSKNKPPGTRGTVRTIERNGIMRLSLVEIV